MSNQLSIDFNPDLTKAYGSCVDYVQARVLRQGIPQKAIAADMDYSPSHLSRKLSNNPNDSMRFTLDDLEKFMEVTNDYEPIKYLVAKFMANAELSKIEQLQAEIERLKGAK